MGIKMICSRTTHLLCLQSQSGVAPQMSLRQCRAVLLCSKPAEHVIQHRDCKLLPTAPTCRAMPTTLHLHQNCTAWVLTLGRQMRMMTCELSHPCGRVKSSVIKVTNLCQATEPVREFGRQDCCGSRGRSPAETLILIQIAWHLDCNTHI